MRIFLGFRLAILVLTGCGSGSNNTAPDEEPAPTDPTGTAVTVEIVDGHEDLVGLVAYQDGSGDWRELTAESGGYSFEVANAAGRYGVAVVPRESEGRVSVEPVMVHATTDDLDNLIIPCPIAYYRQPDLTSELNVSVINVDPGIGSVSVSNGQEGSSGGSPYNFRLAPVSAGMHDVIARAQPGDYLAIRHNAIVMDGSGYAIVDFSARAQVESFGLALTNVGSDDAVNITGSLHTRNKASTTLTNSQVKGDRFPTSYFAAPASLLGPGDLHRLYISSADEYRQSRKVELVFAEAEDIELEFPTGNLALSADEVAAVHYPRYEVNWNDVGANTSVIWQRFETRSDSEFHELLFNVNITPGWLTEDPTYTTPDLSNLDGWQAAWNGIEGEEPSSESVALSAAFSDMTNLFEHLLHLDDRRHSVPGEVGYLEATLDL